MPWTGLPRCQKKRWKAVDGTYRRGRGQGAPGSDVLCCRGKHTQPPCFTVPGLLGARTVRRHAGDEKRRLILVNVKGQWLRASVTSPVECRADARVLTNGDGSLRS